MLPILNKAKMQTGVMVKTRQPDESAEKPESDLESMVKEAVEHYKANDFKALADCVKEIIECCQNTNESESNDYASQNEKASKEQE